MLESGLSAAVVAVPDPPRQGIETSYLVGRQLSLSCALVYAPAAKQIAIHLVVAVNLSGPVLCKVSLQQAKPELPGCRGLLDEAHVECTGEVAADPCGQVEVDLGA